MLKSDLTRSIAATNPDLPVSTCDGLVNAFFDTIIDHMTQGGRVEFRNFGTFFLTEISPRVVRDPRTGKPIDARGSVKVRFRPGKQISHALAASSSSSIDVR